MNNNSEEKTDWETLVSVGVQAREAKDNSQWLLGDLAMQVEKSYGKDSLGKFSADIGVNKNTLNRYRSVSKVWKPSERVEVLSHRHHMVLSSREDRLEWIEKAAENMWSVEELKIRLTKSEQGIEDKVKVGSMLLRKDEWETILKWFAMCLDNPEAMKQITEKDNVLVEKIRKKVDKLKELEKFDYENSIK
jgi:hypothetical protein